MSDESTPIATASDQPKALRLSLWYPALTSCPIHYIVIGAFVLTGAPTLIATALDGNLLGDIPTSATLAPRYYFFGPFFVWPITFLLLFPVIAALTVSFYRQVNRALLVASNEGILRENRYFVGTLNAFYIEGWSRQKQILKFCSIIVISALIVWTYWFGTYGLLGFGGRGEALKTLCTNTWIASASGFPLLGTDAPWFSISFFTAFFSQVVIVAVVLNLFVDFTLWSLTISSLSSRPGPYEINALILHPDTAAGLSQFGSSCWKFYLILLAMSFFVILQVGEKLFVHYAIGHPATTRCVVQNYDGIDRSSPGRDDVGVLLQASPQPNFVLGTTPSRGGSLSVSQILEKWPATWMTFLLFFVLVIPAAFWLPMLPLRRILREEKRQARSAIGQRILSNLPTGERGGEDLAHTLDAVLADFAVHEKSRKLYQWVDEVSDWPFHQRTLTRFFYSYLIPFIAFVAQLAFPYLLGVSAP